MLTGGCRLVYICERRVLGGLRTGHFLSESCRFRVDVRAQEERYENGVMYLYRVVKKNKIYLSKKLAFSMSTIRMIIILKNIRVTGFMSFSRTLPKQLEAISSWEECVTDDYDRENGENISPQKENANDKND